jgi:hypothetical protein
LIPKQVLPGRVGADIEHSTSFPLETRESKPVY